MNPAERQFAFWVSSSHGIEHFLRRMFPPLIPVWVVTLDFPLALAGLLLGAQSLGTAAGQIPFGILADRYDRQYMLPVGIAVAAGFVGVFAVVPFLDVVDIAIAVSGSSFRLPFLVMILAMFGIGLGGSVLHPAGYPLISENVHEDRKGSVYGAWGSASKLGDGLSPAIVGVLLLVLAWQNVLIGLSLVVVAYSVVLYLGLRNFETRPAGAITSDRSPMASTDPASSTGRESADSNEEHEKFGDRSSGFDRRFYLYPMLAIFVFFTIRVLALSGVNVFIPEFITSEYGYSLTVGRFEVTAESTASFYYSALLIVAGVVQLGTGWLVDRIDARLVVIGMMAIAAGLLLAMAFVFLNPILLFVVLLALGGSLWAINPARDALVSEIAPTEREGRTFGYLFTGSAIAGAVSPIAIGYLGDTVGLRTAFAIVSVTTVVAIVPVALLFSNSIWVRSDEFQRSAVQVGLDD